VIAQPGGTGLDGIPASRHLTRGHRARRGPPAASTIGVETMLKTKSKNDPAARGQEATGKTFEGKKVKPVLYVGTAVGHGRYIAAQDESGKLIMGRDGRPIAFRNV
jgi:hypothetical protein